MILKKISSPELTRCITMKLEQASKSSSNSSLGHTLFAKKMLELAPFKAVAFSGWSDWEQDPLNNRSWQWRLNWLSFLPYLMAHHSTTEDDAVLDLAREAIQSWLDIYVDTDTDYPFEFIWHDHATALRAEQLVMFAYYCKEQSPEWAKQHADFLVFLERSLLVHGEWLAKDSFYSEHTNHGLEQARVLLLLGTVFDGEQAREWLKIAKRRISSELSFAFTDEGVHVENSPAYHIFVFKVFLGIIKDYPEEVLGDLADQFNQFSVKALSFITHILRPDGKLPPIGDTEQLPTSDAYRDMFGHTLEYQYFLYALTQGKQGVVPPTLNRVYAMSGYAVFRDQWPVSEDYQKAFHIITKVGCSSRYHHQQDEGHISLYAGGEDWLIDSGLYNYINNDPVRKYMRGRPGHNVPLISNSSYAKEFEHRLSAWQVVEHSEAAFKPSLTMKIDVLLPVEQTRKVAFNTQSKELLVHDEIAAADQQLHNVTLQWHFPKDKTISIKDEQVVVASPSGSRLIMTFEGGVPDNISVAKGLKEERVFSCISYKANQVEPSQVLRVLFKERSALNIKTLFRFEMAKEKLAPCLEASTKVAKPLETLLEESGRDSEDKSKPGQHTVMLGASSASLVFAKAHRSAGLGHVSIFVNDKAQCHQLHSALSKYYLATWLNCHPLNIASTSPVTADKTAIKGLEGIDLLVLTGAGLSKNRLDTVILTMLPLLLKRMTSSGQVWLCDNLPDRLKTVCETWAFRHKLPLSYVVGLDKTLEVSK